MLLSAKTLRLIDTLVNKYIETENYSRVNMFAKQVYNLLSDHPKLSPHVHSLKYRVKDREHLRHKLVRKALDSRDKRKKFEITADNLFEKIDDLAGVRILHLYTAQMQKINAAVLEIIREQRFILLSGPIANTWDSENERFFKSLGMAINERDTMYTSVHYVLGANNIYQTRCELQVRTLMEEVWGEVSHTLNYPDQTGSISCQEQLKVLARVTSSCTRLVDSIFRSYDEHLLIKASRARRHEVVAAKKIRRSEKPAHK
jgi:putative GTP pyrophosphokinase